MHPATRRHALIGEQRSICGPVVRGSLAPLTCRRFISYLSQQKAARQRRLRGASTGGSRDGVRQILPHRRGHRLRGRRALLHRVLRAAPLEGMEALLRAEEVTLPLNSRAVSRMYCLQKSNFACFCLMRGVKCIIC